MNISIEIGSWKHDNVRCIYFFAIDCLLIADSEYIFSHIFLILGYFHVQLFFLEIFCLLFIFQTFRPRDNMPCGKDTSTVEVGTHTRFINIHISRCNVRITSNANVVADRYCRTVNTFLRLIDESITWNKHDYSNTRRVEELLLNMH